MDVLDDVEMRQEIVEPKQKPVQQQTKYTKAEPEPEVLHPAKSLFDLKTMPTYTSSPLDECKAPCVNSTIYDLVTEIMELDTDIYSDLNSVFAPSLTREKVQQ